MPNELKLVIEQTEVADNGVSNLLSRLTLEYPNLANADANVIQLSLVQGLLDSVKAMANDKASA